MAISSPKEQIKAVANGYLSFTVPSLRKHQPNQLKELLAAISAVERDIRREQYVEGDYEGIKKKNFRLTNLRRNRLIIDTFIKQRRIKLST